MRGAAASAAALAGLASDRLAGATGRPAVPPDELPLDRPLSAALLPWSRPGCGAPAAVRLIRRIDRFPGRYLAGFMEVLLVALAGYQAAALFGIAVTPVESGTLASERLSQLSASSILSSGDSVFGSAGRNNSTELAATALKLHGVRQDGSTGRGSAIVSEAGGPQRSFAVGEAISPGLTLKGVGPGFATVTRHGVEERLAFADFPSSTSRTGSPSMSGAPARRPSPAASSINFADPSKLPASLNPQSGKGGGASEQAPRPLGPG